MLAQGSWPSPGRGAPQSSDSRQPSVAHVGARPILSPLDSECPGRPILRAAPSQLAHTSISPLFRFLTELCVTSPARAPTCQRQADVVLPTDCASRRDMASRTNKVRLAGADHARGIPTALRPPVACLKRRRQARKGRGHMQPAEPEDHGGKLQSRHTLELHEEMV